MQVERVISNRKWTNVNTVFIYFRLQQKRGLIVIRQQS